MSIYEGQGGHSLFLAGELTASDANVLGTAMSTSVAPSRLLPSTDVSPEQDVKEQKFNVFTSSM